MRIDIPLSGKMAAAFIALINENEELLCVFHAYGGGGWGIPGGYVDTKHGISETSFEAATREFEEEVGVKYPIDKIFSAVEIFPDAKSTVYVSRVKKNSVPFSSSPSREISSIKWMTQKELSEQRMRPIFAQYYQLAFLVV